MYGGMADDQQQKACDLLTNFFSKGKTRTVSKKTLLLNYGDQPESAYLIKTGKVKVSSYTKSGHERIHYIYKENEIFPVTYIFANELYDAAFIAHTEVQLYGRSMEETRQFFIDNPLALLTIVDQQMEVYTRIFNVNLDRAEEKVAHRLLTFCERFGEAEGSAMRINFPLTVKDVADTVHLSRETTGRILKNFEERGMIVGGRYSYLIYTDKLIRIIDGSNA